MSPVVVALDRDEEGGEVAVADDLPELPFGFEHAGAVQRSAISPELQRFTLRCVQRTISIIDSTGFVLSSVRLRLPPCTYRILGVGLTAPLGEGDV